MGAAYRTITEDEHAAVATLILHVGFGGTPPPEEYLRVAPPEQFRVLDDAGELLSALRVSRLAQWWLGRAVPSAQVLHFASPPQHRGQGHGSRLLAELLAELREAGVPTATLRPSNFPFYRAAGFEAAGAWSLYEARCEHLPKRLAPFRARQVPIDDLAEPRALYQRIAPTRHGAFARDDLSWRWIARRVRDRSALCLVLDGPGALQAAPPDEPAGWVVVAFEFQRDAPVPTNYLQVLDWGCLPGAGSRWPAAAPAWSGWPAGAGAAPSTPAPGAWPRCSPASPTRPTWSGPACWHHPGRTASSSCAPPSPALAPGRPSCTDSGALRWGWLPEHLEQVGAEAAHRGRVQLVAHLAPVDPAGDQAGPGELGHVAGDGGRGQAGAGGQGAAAGRLPERDHAQQRQAARLGQSLGPPAHQLQGEVSSADHPGGRTWNAQTMWPGPNTLAQRAPM